MARRKHKPRKKPQNIIGTEGNDNISTTFAKSVDGRGGDDTINSNIFLLYQNPNIFGGSGNDRMNVGKCFGVVDGGPGDDFMNITGGGPNGRVLGGDGNDTIHNGTGPNARGAEHSRFYGGKGDDFIENFGYKSMIYGEDGNDTIVNQRVFAYDPFATINGGSGDDLISLASGVKGNLIEYKAGDGNDTIQGFNANSTLKIGDGNDTYATLTANSDVLVFVGDSRIVLKDAASLSALNIQGTKSDALPSIKGTDDADTINNDWSYSTIEANAGDDSITNTGANTKINAGDGNDTISNSGADVTIDGGADADTITNSGANASINGEAGNDDIRNEASQVTIDGGAGADRVTNRGASVSIDGGLGNDDIGNISSNVTIVGGDGNDSIYSYAASVSIVGGNGNDSIRNKGYNATIDSGADNDRVANYSDNASIDLGDGNDSVGNYGYNSKIDGGTGSDTIDNRGANVSINAGAGDDVIKNNEHDVTIVGGVGNDNIFNHSAKGYGDRVLFQYNIGDGNDIINGLKANSTLKIGDGTATYSTLTGNSDVGVFVGNSYIVLKDAANLSALNIQGSKVDGIPTIKGTDGADSINNDFSNIVRDGGNGNDTISNSGANVTISGGKGNDFISLTSDATNNLIEYKAGDGNDIINGFNETSTLQIGDGTNTYSTLTRGSDVAVFVGNNYIVLKDAASLSALNIQGSKVDETPTLSGTNGADSIYSEFSGLTINCGKGNDSISLTSDATNNLIQYKAGDGNDVITGFNSTSTLQIGDGTDTYSTLTLDSDVLVFVSSSYVVLKDAASLSALNIQGSKVDGIPTIKGTGEFNLINNVIPNIIIAGGAGNDTIDNGGANVSIDVGEGNDFVNNYSENVSIVGGADNDIILNNGANVTIDSGSGTDSIRNFGKDATIDSGSGTDSIRNFGKDATIDGGKGKDFITNSGANVTITAGADNDTVHNYSKNVTIDGGDDNDTITNSGANVTIDGNEGYDFITNTGEGVQVKIDGGAGHDQLINSGSYTTLNGGAGDDDIRNEGSLVVIDGGAGNDQINLGTRAENNLIQYKAGDGNDVILGFKETSTLAIAGSSYSTESRGGNVIVTVGEGKVSLIGAAFLNPWWRASTLNIVNSTYATFTMKNSGINFESDLPDFLIYRAYQFSSQNSLLALNDNLKNYTVTVKNEEESAKVNWHYGSATLTRDSSLKYQQLAYEKNTVTLTSKTYGDKISFKEDAVFTYGDIAVDLLKGSEVSTNGAKEITFDNNSSANIMAPEGSKINIDASKLTVNNLPITSTNGAGKISVTADGLSFEGYGVQFVDLAVDMESYFGKLAPATVNYNLADKSYTIKNAAQVKTLSDNYTKLTLTLGDDTQACFKVNDKEFLVASDADNLNVIEAKGSTFKIQDKEIDAKNIGRVTIGEQLTFSGTEIDFDGVKVNYAQNKPASYSLDGKEVSIDDAATLTTGEETKTITCAAGSYVINGKSFETSTSLTFTADTSEIKLPLNDARTEIFFDGVKVSGVAGGELVFDLANDKIFIPSDATLNVTSPEEVKLNLAAGNFTFDNKTINTDNALEITADKDSIQVPLSDNPVTLDGAAITGTGTATLDNTDEFLYSIILPNGALVQNVSDNTFELHGKESYAYFGDTNKKVELTEDSTAYIGYDKENGIYVGLDALTFEQVEIQGNDAWTVETSGTSGIDKITGIKNGATLTTSTEYVDAGDLRFEVETDGAGDFIICGEKFTSTGNANYVVRGNSNDEIKVSTLADEFKDDDSEPAGKVYEYDAAGDYTVNGITFHAEKDSKVQTITRGVELDLSSGKFEYDGLTLEGTGSAQINRYNASLIILTDGAKVGTKDEGQGTSPQSLTTSPYYNRQFEISGAVELGDKKFESNSSTRCALLNLSGTIEETIEGETESTDYTLNGFIVDGKFVEIQNDCYDSVKVVDKKITSIEGVKTSAEIYGNGITNVSIVTTGSGEFLIRNKTYKISDDSDGVTFVTDSHGDISEINGLAGSVEGNFENEISINGKAVRLTGASSVKVTSDGENVTEISNVAGDLVTVDDKTYRKDVRVYDMGGAEKLTTSADGTIIFNGNKFDTSAGKTFTLDTSGEVVGLENAPSNELVSANVTELEASAENLATINLSTTDGLEEVFGDFSEGLTVNGVFVKVTDSTNFVVKNDDENIYIETTAADTFTINGKTFETYSDKTIFKLDTDGDVSEIVTDKFYLYPDEDAYLIDGDFSDEIIFNGKKFCVTGTNDTSVFIGEETVIGIELAQNSVEVVESSDASEIAISGAGEIIIGDNTFSTSDDFIGIADESSVENFVGTLSGKLGGIKLVDLTITTDDEFSVTSDGEKITAIENLRNGSLTCSDLNDVTINGAKVSVDNSEEVTLTITNGELKVSELMNNATVTNSGEKVNFVTKESGEFFIGEDDFKVTSDDSVVFAADDSGKVNEISGLDKGASLQTANGGSFVVNGTALTAKADDTFIGLANGSARLFDPDAVVVEKNITLEADSLAIVEELTKKISITASAGEDTIYTTGKNVTIDLKAGGATKIFATEGRATVENYNVTTGAAFLTENENIADAIEEKSIAFDDGRLTVNSAQVTFADDAASKVINFVDTEGETQKVFFASDASKLDVSKESGNLILVGGIDSTIIGGKSNNTIFAGEGALIDFGGGRNVIKNFTAANKISVDAATANFEFDGENVSIKSDGGRAILESVTTEGGAAEISLVDGKAYIAQDGENISVNELADLYYGKKSGVDFSAYDESLTIDLSKNFYGINRVTVGGGLNTLFSSSRNETLTGNSEGTTEFIFNAGAGHDVIQNFNFAEDKISVGAAVSNVVLRNSGDVIIQLGDEWITLEDAQGKSFRINDFIALVDKNISYDEAANYFLATAKNASVIVSEEAEVWLDGSHGKNFVGNIKTLDASNSDGRNTLAGNDLDNVICAGAGDASLWGGNGNDLLVGGKAHNLFFYTSGNDTIQSANDGDAVILSTTTLEQISSTSITSSGVAINFTNGGSLTVESTSDITYQLADGSQFFANHEQSTWQAR